MLPWNISFKIFNFFQVCLGFVENIDDKGVRQKVTNDFINSGDFEVDVGGIRFSYKTYISPLKY